MKIKDSSNKKSNELSLQDKKRKPCRDFLKICRSEYDNLLESSPNIDLDIINDFNKKFNDKYPNPTQDACRCLRQATGGPMKFNESGSDNPTQEPVASKT